jgi:hypothetical protein
VLRVYSELDGVTARMYFKLSACIEIPNLPLEDVSSLLKRYTSVKERKLFVMDFEET